MDDHRSRSSSRERSSRRKHRKHKHRSRRSRTRSRSRSFERYGQPGGSGIHINPAFGMPPPHSAPPPQSQMGYSATQLLQTNNMMEAEIARLNSALIAEQGQKQIEIQRNHMLQQELRNAQIQRDQANKKCNEVMSERRMMIEMKTEMANRINGLEVSGRMLREEVANANKGIEAKNEEIRAITYQSEIVRQQINALNERNAALKSKCETMVAQNRRQYEELEGKQKLVETAQLNVRKAETDLQCANLEIQRLLRELESSRQLETTSISEKQSFEQLLARKDDEIRVAGYKATSELKNANEKIEKLENQLKSENPAAYDDMTVEAIYIAIETIKSTYEKQLTRLEEEIEELKQEKTKQMEIDVESQEGNQMIEELPAYLQTPMKPDPAKMGGVKRTIQCKINLESGTPSQPSTSSPDRPPRPASGPPVDSPVTWHKRKTFERLPNMIVPLFGTTGISETSQGEPSSQQFSLDGMQTTSTSSIPSTSESSNHQNSSLEPMTSSEDVPQTINLDTHHFSEEDLLLTEPNDLISPYQNLSEQQLLDLE
ncbi:hypothetical protein GCK72_019697 [Caenorhabditis remanei]|uniref:Uncharacterized protein n=1 Tax=Caenorhabditis remanei TaxID=31234 RepID=A0A6A5GEX9_CAERE|nr:hypothetical protein GCK72_019697 [Caenorhabditis remanei]KAF1753141.1 hypothetical protein GCK72_019697 [Caenorhabditis remanei]